MFNTVLYESAINRFGNPECRSVLDNAAVDGGIKKHHFAPDQVHFDSRGSPVKEKDLKTDSDCVFMPFVYRPQANAQHGGVSVADSDDDIQFESLARKIVLKTLGRENIYARLDRLEQRFNNGTSRSVEKAKDTSLQLMTLSILKLLQPEDAEEDSGYVRVGGAYDGGYVMYEPALSSSVAYSFGISDDVSWDADMAERGFDIYMYDHTIPALPYENERFHWSKQGILGVGEANELKTLSYFLRANGHDENEDLVLKIDVEGAEWDVFSNIDEDILCRFQQIVVEFHWLDTIDNIDKFKKIYASLSKLSDRFAPIHIHGNNYSDLCILGNVPIPQVLEVTYLRRSSFKTKPGTRLFPTPLDRPNNPTRPDICLGSFKFET